MTRSPPVFPHGAAPSRPFHETPGRVRLWCADVLEALAQESSGSAQCCVTSPPYWGLRDYGLPPTDWPEVAFTPMAGLPSVSIPSWRGCLGLEPEPLAFVGHLVHVFRAVRRVLADDGTLWLNIGDSYAGAWGAQSQGADYPGNLQGGSMLSARQIQAHPKTTGTGSLKRTPGLKNKDLIGIPWRVAFALQADAWFLRSDVVWAKPNPMPESVTDRPTKAHEYVFLFSKSERYLYDAEAVREPMVAGTRGSSFTAGKTGDAARALRPVGMGERADNPAGRNARSVWTIATQPYRGAHFATMPRDLAGRCVLAGSRAGDTVLDPFNGAGTTGLVSMRHERRFVGVDLNPEYCGLAVERWRSESSLFLDAATILSGGAS